MKLKTIKNILQIIFSKKYLLLMLREQRKEHSKNYVKKNYGLTLPAIDFLDFFPNYCCETVSPYSFLDGACLPTDIMLLKNFARKFPQGKFLEIGTWRGETVANVSTLMKECHTLDIKDYALFSKNYRNITHHIGDSKTFDFSKLGKFDLIFIDGDHGYEAVKSDTRNAFKLIHNKSIIVWHDYRMRLSDFISWPTYAGILDGLPSGEHLRLYYITNTLCAVYMKGTFRTTEPTLNKTFNLQITASKLNKNYLIGEVPWGKLQFYC